MLDINLIRADPERVKKGIMTKNADPKLVDEFLWFDGKWRALMQEVENLRARQKKAGEERNIKEAKQLKEEIHAKEGALREVENTRDTVLRKLPNLPLPSVPVGASDKENMVLREVGEKPKFDFAPRDYLALAEALDLVDMERAAKVSGSRFAYLKNEAVLLEFAIARLVFDTLGKEGFVPLVPPVIVNEEMMRGMGYVDRGEDLDETYYLEKDKQYLVGTAEQSVGPMHAGEIFSEQELPKRYVAFSTSFRREAGSYGKDTKGILRVHQFDKLEMFSFTQPEDSHAEHEFLLAMEEKLMQALSIPYRVLGICTADLGVPAAAKYDIEAWLPGQNGGKGEYRETHSTSNTTDFQARRLNIRCRADEQAKPEFVHTLNGTACAIGRILIALMENYQQKDGSIKVPDALVPSMDGMREIRRQ